MQTNSRSSRAIEISAPARIHIDLIDMSGQLSRINGSVGLAIDEPRCRLRISAAPGLEIVGVAAEDEAFVRREIDYAVRKLDLEDTNFRLEISSAAPRHVGLGSGTQWQLALLAILSRFFGRTSSLMEIARHSTRGRTSGIGVHAFQVGGFIVDGGRRVDSARPAFKPSSFADPGDLPPLIFRCDFPDDWGIVLFVPEDFAGLSGEEERSFMERNTPIPGEEVARVCHSLLMETMPSILEQDFDAFCASVSRLQSVGWKARHWARSDLAGLARVADSLTRSGIGGVGLSSTGPSLFGFYRKTTFPDREALRSRLMSDLGRIARGELLVTEGANHGATLIALADA
jgi:beta-ribofuranosylaminobenzene 5'-phosphate synthase